MHSVRRLSLSWCSGRIANSRFYAGGSTIVVLFEKAAGIEWDEDLLINSRACLETLVRVGMGLGRGKRKPAVTDGSAQ